jgi:hypothetical protein
VSKKTGIKGVTPLKLERIKRARIRQDIRDALTTDEQLARLAQRPGKSLQETKRLT